MRCSLRALTMEKVWAAEVIDELIIGCSQVCDRGGLVVIADDDVCALELDHCSGAAAAALVIKGVRGAVVLNIVVAGRWAAAADCDDPPLLTGGDGGRACSLVHCRRAVGSEA